MECEALHGYVGEGIEAFFRRKREKYGL